jgi:hypothetical protein
VINKSIFAQFEQNKEAETLRTFLCVGKSFGEGECQRRKAKSVEEVLWGLSADFGVRFWDRITGTKGAYFGNDREGNVIAVKLER